MLGKNEISINQETMVAALQLYFASIYQAGKVPVVKAVASKAGGNGKGYAGAGEGFYVDVEGCAVVSTETIYASNPIVGLK